MTAKKPVEFSEDIGLRVCGYISEGLSLRKVEQQAGMPSKAGILEGEAFKAANELNHPKALLVDQYARAREVQADCLADDIINIADDSMFGQHEDDEGNIVTNTQHIQRDRLRVDARKWMAGKLRPKKYGDKTVLEGGEKPLLTESRIDAATLAQAMKIFKEKL